MNRVVYIKLVRHKYWKVRDLNGIPAFRGLFQPHQIRNMEEKTYLCILLVGQSHNWLHNFHILMKSSNLPYVCFHYQGHRAVTVPSSTGASTQVWDASGLWTGPVLTQASTEESEYRALLLLASQVCFITYYAHGRLSRRQIHKLVINVKMMKFHYYIWNHCEKCIQKSTNLPGIGLVIFK